jgi:hypothetical protein
MQHAQIFDIGATDRLNSPATKPAHWRTIESGPGIAIQIYILLLARFLA